MPVSPLAGQIIALIGVIASLCVGFGVFGVGTEQVVIAAAGSLVSIVFGILNSTHILTEIKAGVRGGHQATTKREVV